MYTVLSPCSRCASSPAPVRRRVHGPRPSPSSAASSTCTLTETRCTSCCTRLVARVLLYTSCTPRHGITRDRGSLDPCANCYMWFYEYAALHHLRSDFLFIFFFHPRLSPSSFTLLFHRYTEITKKDGGVVSKPNSVEYFDFDHQVRHVGETHGRRGEVEILNQS